MRKSSKLPGVYLPINNVLKITPIEERPFDPKNAGIRKCVGITHGFEDATTLRSADAANVVESLDQVIPLFSN